MDKIMVVTSSYHES